MNMENKGCLFVSIQNANVIKEIIDKYSRLSATYLTDFKEPLKLEFLQSCHTRQYIIIVMTNLFTDKTSERAEIVIMSSSLRGLRDRLPIECQKPQGAINCCLMESKHRSHSCIIDEGSSERTDS